MLARERKPADDFVGVVQAEYVGGGTHRERGNRVAQRQVVEDVHRIRAQLDPGADLAQLGGLLEHLDVVAGLQQAGGGRQAADARAGDQDLLQLSTPGAGS